MTATVTVIESLCDLPRLVRMRLTTEPPEEGDCYQFTPATGYGDKEPRPIYFVEVRDD